METIFVVVFSDPDKRGRQCKSNLDHCCVNFSGEPSMDTSEKEYDIVQDFYHDKDLDIAVLEIKNPDQYLPPGLRLRREGTEQLYLPYVSLIGYGHPEQSRANTKTFEHYCRTVSPNSAEMRSALTWLGAVTDRLKTVLSNQGVDPSAVDIGYGDYDAAHNILFNCFMEHGSSGAPIIRVCHGAEDTAKSIEVIGIVTHGLPHFFFLLSPLGRALVPNRCRFEAGTKTSHIYRSMKARNNDLAERLFNVEPMDIN